MLSRLCILAIALVGAPALAEEPRPSMAACDVNRLSARDLAECLRADADKTDKDLTAVVAAAVKSIDGRAGLLSGQKSRWKRSLNDSEAQWLSWRDGECQDVAPFESGMSAKGGDPRLACLIDQNSHRIAELKSRYP